MDSKWLRKLKELITSNTAWGVQELNRSSTTGNPLKLNAKQIKNIAIDPRFQDAVKIFMSTKKHDRL